MPGKYQITAEVVIATSIEAEGYLEAYDALEFEDTSSFYGEDIRATGNCRFIVEADSEEEAQEKAREILDNIHFHSNDIEWEIEDTSIEDVEEIEPPMDMDRAKEILLALVRSLTLTDEQRSALTFVLEEVLNP